MNTPFEFDQNKRMAPGWNTHRMHIRKRLTDKKIEEYKKNGFYSEHFKETRRTSWQAIQQWRAKHGI